MTEKSSSRDHPDLRRVLENFELEGFTIALTPHRSAGKVTRTRHLSWRGFQLAYLNDRLSREGALLGYRFDPGTGRARNACPAGFSLEAFARKHGLDPATDLRVRHDHGAGKSYLRVLTAKAAKILMRNSALAADADADADAHVFVDESGAQPSDTETTQSVDPLAEDLEELFEREHRGDLDSTTRKQLVDARIGQGEFRRALESNFGQRCAVTGIGLREVLRASHVKPWARPTTDTERLDPDNGLLLAAHLDALFDRHLITFDQAGGLRMSSRITSVERNLLVLSGGLLRPPSPQQWAYLQQHNARFEEEEQKHRKRVERANRSS